MAWKPADKTPPPGSPPAPVRDRPAERTGRRAEREGPLDVERLAKSDGRALILYTVREPER